MKKTHIAHFKYDGINRVHAIVLTEQAVSYDSFDVLYPINPEKIAVGDIAQVTVIKERMPIIRRYTSQFFTLCDVRIDKVLVTNVELEERNKRFNKLYKNMFRNNKTFRYSNLRNDFILGLIDESLLETIWRKDLFYGTYTDDTEL